MYLPQDSWDEQTWSLEPAAVGFWGYEIVHPEDAFSVDCTGPGYAAVQRSLQQVGG